MSILNEEAACTMFARTEGFSDDLGSHAALMKLWRSEKRIIWVSPGTNVEGACVIDKTRR